MVFVLGLTEYLFPPAPDLPMTKIVSQ